MLITMYMRNMVPYMVPDNTRQELMESWPDLRNRMVADDEEMEEGSPLDSRAASFDGTAEADSHALTDGGVEEPDDSAMAHALTDGSVEEPDSVMVEPAPETALAPFEDSQLP